MTVEGIHGDDGKQLAISPFFTVQPLLQAKGIRHEFITVEGASTPS